MSLLGTSRVIMQNRLKAMMPYWLPERRRARPAPTPTSPKPAPKYGLSLRDRRKSLRGMARCWCALNGRRLRPPRGNPRGTTIFCPVCAAGCLKAQLVIQSYLFTVRTERLVHFSILNVILFREFKFPSKVWLLEVLVVVVGKGNFTGYSLPTFQPRLTERYVFL